MLTAPRVQPIYFAGFPYKTEVDQFLQALAASGYWTSVLSEYGVGRPTILAGDESPQSLGATLSISDVVGLFAHELQDRAPVLGPPRRDTLYTLFFPPTTTITADKVQLCSEGGASGLHAEVSVAGTSVPIIVIPTCTKFAGDATLTGVSALTPALSHELVEAAADPLPDSAPAYASTDPAHAMWGVALMGAEIADLCENEHPNLITPPDIGSPVQRIWSNRSAHAGTGPCVPVPPGEAYFVAVPRLPQVVSVDVDGTRTSLPAVVAGTTASASVTLDFRGGADAPASWQSIALEYRGPQSLDGDPTVRPVLGQRGSSRAIAVAPASADSGVFPLIVLSHATTGALHVWVGAIARR